MPNPVTAALMKNISDAELHDFISRWDDLEALIIQIYRGNEVTPLEKAQFSKLNKELRVQYSRWREALAPYWNQSRIKDQVGLNDPFSYLLNKSSAVEYIGDWDAMKHLPAAREALNNFLLSLIEEQTS
jgi:hypothetical protein